MLFALRQPVILLAALFAGAIASPVLAQDASGTSPGAPAGAESQELKAVEKPEPWYRGWRLKGGLYIQYHSLDVAERGTGQKASILRQHDYGFFPFGSTPEWVFHKQGIHNLGFAVFFGAGQFTVDEQKIHKPKSEDEEPSCDTCDAGNYKNLGTSISGSYQFITPALVYTLAGKNSGTAFRMAVGIGVARGAASGDVYVTGSGKVGLNGSGRIAGTPKRIRFSESVASYDNRSYLILMESVFENGWGISASSDFMELDGEKVHLRLEEFRGGISYEIKF